MIASLSFLMVCFWLSDCYPYSLLLVFTILLAMMTRVVAVLFLVDFFFCLLASIVS